MPRRGPERPGKALSAPIELSDSMQAPEGLRTALIASEFNIDQVLDEYIAALRRRPDSVWQEADYHGKVLVRLILPEHRYGEALEQALVSRIRERLHTTT